MKIVDLQLYRIRKEIRALEERVASLALYPAKGAAREIKTCFREWLTKSK